MADMSSTPLSFILRSLNQETQCIDGVTLTKFTDTLAFDAMAIFYVNIDDMKNVFGYQLDGTNINNLDSENTKYYVDMEKWPANLTLNPSHAMMFNPLSTGGFDISDTTISNSKKLVKHDYIRYLAQRLFNTTRAVDLMSNEFEIIENLAGNGSLFTGMNSRNILDILKGISTNASTALDGTDANNNNKKYLTNNTSSQTNIVRSIIEQISNGDPKRFSDLVDSSNNHLIRPVPFIVDDKLHFTLKIKAAPSQNDLTKVSTIPDRTYLISLILTNGDANTRNLQVADSAFIGDIPYSKYYPIAVKHTDTDASGNTIYADGAQATKIPSNKGYFNNGWYYKNDITAPMLPPTSSNRGYNLRKINWYFPPSTGAKVSDLKYMYITGQIISNKSLPFIVVYTKHPTPSAVNWRLSSRTYSCGSGPSVVPVNTTAHQLVVDMSNNDGISCPSINGYTQIMLTLSSSNQVGNFDPTEEIFAYAVSTNSAAQNTGDCEFILNTFSVYDKDPLKIPVYYFEQL